MAARVGRGFWLSAVAALSSLWISGCGGDSDAGNPDSELTPAEATAPLDQKAPAELRPLREQANSLIGGGVDAFDERLADLRGIPVVVNVWASWCGPCRLEFPFFQTQATKRGSDVAFLGVDTEDSEDAANTFLEELPLPYPSYFDPDGDIADELDVGPGIPNTLFIGADGEVDFHVRGPVQSEGDLAHYIDHYLR